MKQKAYKTCTRYKLMQNARLQMRSKFVLVGLGFVAGLVFS